MAELFLYTSTYRLLRTITVSTPYYTESDCAVLFSLERLASLKASLTLFFELFQRKNKKNQLF